VARDGDLELAIAIDAARCGEVDSALAILAEPTLQAALEDTLPMTRNVFYGSQREAIYSDGKFDGWAWYVWRARAELSLARGRWEDATVAARCAVRARPVSGKDWLLLAVAAGRAGHDDEARAAADRAAALDRTLPEACYLEGVWAWRTGRRTDAQKAFRAATEADRTFQPAGMALVRMQLPGAVPDTLPARFLTGGREAGIVTSPVGPKMEDFIQVDRPIILTNKMDPAVPDSLKKPLFGYRLPLWVLVDENGRVVLNEVAWTKPDQIAPSVVADLLATLPSWRFMPALVHDRPRRAWVDLLYSFAL
jgi:tetratricopeptide (TPR) repeat protein